MCLADPPPADTDVEDETVQPAELSGGPLDRSRTGQRVRGVRHEGVRRHAFGGGQIGGGLRCHRVDVTDRDSRTVTCGCNGDGTAVVHGRVVLLTRPGPSADNERPATGQTASHSSNCLGARRTAAATAGGQPAVVGSRAIPALFSIPETKRQKPARTSSSSSSASLHRAASSYHVGSETASSAHSSSTSSTSAWSPGFQSPRPQAAPARSKATRPPGQPAGVDPCRQGSESRRRGPRDGRIVRWPASRAGTADPN